MRNYIKYGVCSYCQRNLGKRNTRMDADGAGEICIDCDYKEEVWTPKKTVTPENATSVTKK